MSHASRLTPSFCVALAISLALHALLAVVLALYLSYAPAPDELAQLDLTSVDLSFSETVEESAAAVASAPSTPSEPAKAAPPPPPVDAVSSPRPPVDAVSSPHPSVDAVSSPRPPVDAVSSPRPTEAKLPTPAEPINLLEPVIVSQESEVARQETRDETRHETRHETRDEKRDEKPEETRDEARVDAPPKPRRSIKPDYPRESRLRGEQGDVSLELDVAADGSVSAVRILKSPGYPLLDEAAVKAARGARFTPAKSGGKPVASTVRLTLNFRLK